MDAMRLQLFIKKKRHTHDRQYGIRSVDTFVHRLTVAHLELISDRQLWTKVSTLLKRGSLRQTLKQLVMNPAKATVAEHGNGIALLAF